MQHWSDALGDHGEPAGVRTLDLLIKSQLLYRLSYRLTLRPLLRKGRAQGQGQKPRGRNVFTASLRAGLVRSRTHRYMARMTGTALTFSKMHGAGNDFVVIDSRSRAAGMMDAALARAIGDRHRGVGFDQLAELRPAEDADLALDFWNADGTRAGACGNATRCVAAMVMGQTGAQTLTILTARGFAAGRGSGRSNLGQYGRAGAGVAGHTAGARLRHVASAAVRRPGGRGNGQPTLRVFRSRCRGSAPGHSRPGRRT